MKCVSKNSRTVFEKNIFSTAEKKYSIDIRGDIKEFIKINAGGWPIKEIITFDGDEYEVRAFLSADLSDKNYCIEKPMDYFLNKTKGKIVPVAVDSGDNYYCVNNETGKVYYWRASEDLYYCIADNIEEFSAYFLK